MKKKNNLPDFVLTLTRRRRTAESFLAEHNINTVEAFDDFVEKKSNDFSFSDEFLSLRSNIAKTAKEPVKSVSASAVTADEAVHTSVAAAPVNLDLVSDELVEEDGEAADLKKKLKKRKVDSAV